MFTPSPELIIMIFGILGVLTALEHLPSVRAEALIFKFLFVLGIFTQLLAHSFQYYYAITNTREAETEADAAMAIALYAYTADDVPLLQATSKTSYIVGYRIFKDGQIEESIPFFRQGIFEQRFVASSYFLLAYISSHDKDGNLVHNSVDKDWSQAEIYLDKAIAANPAYAPAYYVRASLYANSNRIRLALENLPKGVLPLKLGRISCQNINKPESIEREWKPIADNVEFRKLQEQCRRVHGIHGI